ncbi:hypothetical protein [Roseobacter fucihabitans]|nr:hypothetical protein [Roseobacter litoralis]
MICAIVWDNVVSAPLKSCCMRWKAPLALLFDPHSEIAVRQFADAGDNIRDIGLCGLLKLVDHARQFGKAGVFHIFRHPVGKVPRGGFGQNAFHVLLEILQRLRPRALNSAARGIRKQHSNAYRVSSGCRRMPHASSVPAHNQNRSIISGCTSARIV